MIDIDYIMNLLDWNQSEESQEKGVQLAQKVQNFNVFIQPCNKAYSKNVWGNCAKIISQKSDDELSPYLSTLLEWLEDLNWPGALIILDRLKVFSGKKLKKPFMALLTYANSLHSEEGLMWLDVLSELLDNEQLKAELPKEVVETLQKHYHNCGFWWDDEEERIRWDWLE